MHVFYSVLWEHFPEAWCSFYLVQFLMQISLLWMLPVNLNYVLICINRRNKPMSVNIKVCPQWMCCKICQRAPWYVNDIQHHSYLHLGIYLLVEIHLGFLKHQLSQQSSQHVLSLNTSGVSDVLGEKMFKSYTETTGVLSILRFKKSSGCED